MQDAKHVNGTPISIRTSQPRKRDYLFESSISPETFSLGRPKESCNSNRNFRNFFVNGKQKSQNHMQRGVYNVSLYLTYTKHVFCALHFRNTLLQSKHLRTNNLSQVSVMHLGVCSTPKLQDTFVKVPLTNVPDIRESPPRDGLYYQHYDERNSSCWQAAPFLQDIRISLLTACKDTGDCSPHCYTDKGYNLDTSNSDECKT